MVAVTNSLSAVTFFYLLFKSTACAVIAFSTKDSRKLTQKRDRLITASQQSQGQQKKYETRLKMPF